MFFIAKSMTRTTTQENIINYLETILMSLCRGSTCRPMLLCMRVQLCLFVIAPPSRTIAKCWISKCGLIDKAAVDSRLRPCATLPRAVRTITICEKWRHPETESTYHIALSSEEARATATVNMHWKFREVWTRCSWDMRADRRIKTGQSSHNHKDNIKHGDPM